MFVTLDKSGGTFSPSTSYRDPALSRDQFHWETQGAASVTSLEIVPRPPDKRAADNPWPQWARVFRTAGAHEEGGWVREAAAEYARKQAAKQTAAA